LSFLKSLKIIVIGSKRSWKDKGYVQTVTGDHGVWQAMEVWANMQSGVIRWQAAVWKVGWRALTCPKAAAVVNWRMNKHNFPRLDHVSLPSDLTAHSTSVIPTFTCGTWMEVCLYPSLGSMPHSLIAQFRPGNRNCRVQAPLYLQYPPCSFCFLCCSYRDLKF
jgi:hypothetical protein